MYKTQLLNNVIECMEESEDIYCTDYSKEIGIQSLRLLIDKFNLDNFTDNYEFTQSDYEKYFIEIIKKFDNKSNKDFLKEYQRRDKFSQNMEKRLMRLK